MSHEPVQPTPWPFSEAPKPGEPTVPNLPTDEGRAVGAQIARLTDAAEVELLKKFPHMARRCGDCAFKAGTLPNGCAETVMDAIKCVVEVKTFYCHKNVPEGVTPTRPCAGWLAAISQRDVVAAPLLARRERNRRKAERRMRRA